MRLVLKSKKGTDIVSVNPKTVASVAIGSGIVLGKKAIGGLSSLVSNIPSVQLDFGKKEETPEIETEVEETTND